MAHSVWTGGSRHPGRAALPHKNIHTKDSNKLESHIREIDTAMQEVESSNQQLVDNMEKVSDIVVNHDLMYQ